MKKDYLLIIDSNYLAYVHKFALSSGLSYQGHRTEIIYGFVKQIFELAKKFDTNNVVFCWDSKNSKRREIYSAYKYKRRGDKSEEEIAGDMIAFRQFDKLKNSVLRNFGFQNVFYQDGYESDDLIASLVMDYEKVYTSIVISSDEDLYQLLDYCSVYNISKHETMTKEIFTREYGIKPKQWADVKSIAGCSTDCVPGIRGVGEKKAISFLKGDLKKGKVLDSIERRTGKLTRAATDLMTRLPFPGTGHFQIVPNTFSEDKYIEVCENYNFESLLKEKNIELWRKIFLR